MTGLGVGALSAAVPLYQSETVPRQVRGALVGTYQLFITLGKFQRYVAEVACDIGRRYCIAPVVS